MEYHVFTAAYTQAHTTRTHNTHMHTHMSTLPSEQHVMAASLNRWGSLACVSTKTDSTDAAALPAPSFYSTWNLSLILMNNDEK